jgi:energy-coupling factor transporter ATP-binding protein EcfA2
MSNINPKYFLRPEAGPVPCSKLQKRAKEALKDIIGALSAAVRSTQVPSDDPTIDTNRASRIFFVSGEPGSGKSTLYLTLRAMLQEKYSEKYSEGCDELTPLIGTLIKAVRWLEPLDLEVAVEEEENLLAAVLVRLFRALTLNESDTALPEPCEEAIADLEELARDIGIAWEGNLRERASAIDPDTYSEEVMRTQRARLGVNERLKQALDKLAENGCYACRKETLFILPVDDFYLKPDASLQLLRLLRMISVPRLFFLVMGDITTVEALFVEKSLADWTAVAGPEIFAAMPPKRKDEALARARELRARYLRKLLPPGQRVTIEVMDWYEALEFKPERLDGKETDVNTITVDTLESLLKEVKLDPPAESEEAKSRLSLLTFLITPPFKGETGREEAQEAYTALQILDATPREIMDLWFALYKLKSQVKGNDDPPQLLSLVEEFTKLVIEEQNFLDEEEQESLRVVLPTRHYSPRDIQYDMKRLSLEPPDQERWTDEITWTDESKKSKSLRVRKHLSWKLRVGKGLKRNEGAEPFAKLLPPRPTAWLVLLHDLAWGWNHDSLTENLIERVCRELGKSSLLEREAGSQSGRDDNSEAKQKLDPPLDLRGWAAWYDESTYTHFTMPALKTFREMDRFLYVWSSGLDWWQTNKNITKEPEQIRKLIHLWGLAGLTVNDSSYQEFATRKEGWFEEQLENFRKGTARDEQSKDWREDIDELEKDVLGEVKPPERLSNS